MTKPGQFRVRVLSRVKHGALRDALVRLGWSQAEAAKRLKMNQHTFGRMINLKQIPILSRRQQELLMTWTGEAIQDLFPPEIRKKEFLDKEKNFEVDMEVPLARLASAHAMTLLESPDQALERRELRSALEQAMGNLTERERQVIEMSFIDGLSDIEIQRRLGLCRNRPRQIKNKALRKLRSPWNRKIMEGALAGDPVGAVIDIG